MLATESKVPALEMRGISKTFPGVKALNNVQLKAWGGEVLALMGENGAGKSTLMKILSGAYHADSGGEILIHGEPARITDPIAAKRHRNCDHLPGAGACPNLTVAENIYLGNEPRKSGGLVDRRAMFDGCRPVLEHLGAPFGPQTPVGGLSIAEQQLVEIARALHSKSRPPRSGRAHNAALLPGDRPFVRAHPPTARAGHCPDLHQPSHGRGV